MEEVSGYMKGNRGELYCTWHQPAGVVRGAAVILAPYGEERKCAYRFLYTMARHLARAGIATLRFDYWGTGESSGSLAQASLDDWLDDARLLIRHVREEIPDRPLLLVGARLGGLMAARVAADSPVNGIALLEPLVSGAEYLDELLRRKQVKEMMGGGKANSIADDAESSWTAGHPVDFDGFSMGAAFAGQLRALDLISELQPIAASPLLLLHVSGARKLTGKWAAIGEHCQAAEHRNLKTVREKPFWGRTDHHSSEEIVGEVGAFGEQIMG